MKKVLLVIAAYGILSFLACNSSPSGETATSGASEEQKADENVDYKGIGKFTDVKLTTPLNQDLVKDGEAVYNMKCLSCHKLTDEKLVGPGWKGVTKLRTPEWLMNFITNTDEMLNKSPVAQKMLEECLTRMPNQNLSDHDARAVLEFMRKNDGEQ